jgi:uncharacterized GH25 family protein
MSIILGLISCPEEGSAREEKKSSVVRIICRYLIEISQKSYLFKKIIKLLFLFVASTHSPAFCHEFWLEPSQNNESEVVQFSMLVGESLRGDTLPYFKKNLTSSNIIDKSGIKKLSGYDGDDPAFSINRADRYYGIAISTQYSKIIFEKYNKFDDYILKEGLAEDLVNFKFTPLLEERYARHSKFFWGSDPALKHAKHIFGHPLEFIFSNRICRKKQDILIFRLMKEGRPFASRAVFITDAVQRPRRRKVLTDETGLFEIKLRDNSGFLINSVVISQDKKARKLRSEWGSIRISNIETKCEK